MEYPRFGGIPVYGGIKKKMKKWELTASTDGNTIDYSEIIESETKPDFWTCYNIASAHGCEFFAVEEVTVLDYDTTAAEHCAGLPVDILSPSECADLFGRPVRAGDTVHYPGEV